MNLSIPLPWAVAPDVLLVGKGITVIADEVSLEWNLAFSKNQKGGTDIAMPSGHKLNASDQQYLPKLLILSHSNKNLF